MKKFIVLTAVVVLTTAISNTSAGMWWQRGDPGSTWQDWTFEVRRHEAEAIAVAELFATMDVITFVANEERDGNIDAPRTVYAENPCQAAEAAARALIA